MLGRASPRNPRVRMAKRSSSLRSCWWRSARWPAGRRRGSCRSRRRTPGSGTGRPVSISMHIRRAPGIQGVFHQLLDHRRRPFHHLAGGDFVGENFGQDPDACHGGESGGLRPDDGVKIENQTVSKKVQFQGAQISRSEAYSCTPQRLRDAAQRRNWTFCGIVRLGRIGFGGREAQLLSAGEVEFPPAFAPVRPGAAGSGAPWRSILRLALSPWGCRLMGSRWFRSQ